VQALALAQDVAKYKADAVHVVFNKFKVASPRSGSSTGKC
jgi:hypothetical protein